MSDRIVRQFHARGALFATAVALVVTIALVGQTVPASATTPAVTVTAAPSTTTPGSKLDLTAAMPVSAAGTISQEIVMQIDPTKVKLTSSEDITAPAGWTVSYCSTTCTSPPTNFSTTKPTTDAGWAAVKAVLATGSVDSQGEFQGRQLAARTATIAVPASGPFSSSGSGDGWNVFFDDRGYVFNVFHHASGNRDNLDCRDRSGVSCGANWPYGSGTGGGKTSNVSSGWYDPIHQHVWYDSTRSYEVGFECVDVSDISNPKMCGGSIGSTFVSGGISKSPIAGTPNFGSFNSPATRGIAQVGGRIFSQSDGGATPKVICVDTQANDGLGAKCPGSPFDPTPGQASNYEGAVMVSGGKLWVTSSNTSPRGGMSCFDPDTLQLCSESWPKTWSMGSAGQLNHLFEIPTAAGGIGGICATTSNCYSTTGTAVTLNGDLASWYDGVGDAFGYSEHALRQGSRLYRGNGNGAAAGVGSKTFSCWDQASNSGTGAVCANWPISVTNYAIALDPLNDNCVWKNDHQNSIKAYDATTATENCLTPPSRVVIPAETAVPRMACSTPGSGVREWRSIKLLAPLASGYASAALTILDSSGAEISGWTDRIFDPVNDRLIDLAALSVATTGQKPTFIVQYAGLTSATNTSVEVVAVGDAPELCLNPQAIATCPTISSVGLQPDSPSMGAFSTLGDGSSTTSSGTTAYAQGSTSVAVDAGPSPSCAAKLTGKALSNDANTLPVPGATVTLLDSNGSAVTYPNGHPQAGQAITALTDANGGYSFGLLAPGTYKVKFVNTPTTTVQNSRKIASSTGPGASSDFANASGSGDARATVSPATAITNAGPGVVNGYYIVGPTAPSRTTVALTNTTVIFDPFTSSGSSPAATPSSGSSFTSAAKGATRLCGPSESAPNCSQTSIATAQGTWSVETALGANVGKISFTPTSNFSGTVSPVTYVVTDAASQTASGTLSPSYPTPPTVQSDTSSGAWDTNQTVSVLTNDFASSGASLAASTVKLCPQPQPSAPYTAINCNESSVTIAGEGTYTANVNGTVTFDPLSTFTGQVQTPVRYVVQDSIGQVGSALVTPTVLPPGPSAGVADTTTGIFGAPQSVNLLTNDTTPSGATFTASSTRLCAPGTSAPNCVSTTVDVPNVGTYSVTNGTVTFTPCIAAVTSNCTTGTAYTGTPTALGYQVTDSLGRVVNSTYTPTVVPTPTATPDAQTGAFATNQTYTPASNDTAGLGTALDVTSVRLCPTNATAPFTSNNCSATSVTTADGVYSLDTTTGTVTFDPSNSFSGVATVPVNYVVADALGQYASSTITPTVTPPGASVATANTTTGVVGASQSVNLLTNDTAPSGVTFTASSARLCAPGTSAPNCVSTTVDVPNVGAYSVTNGTVTFTPCTSAVTANCTTGTAFTGTPTALGYQVSDSLGRVVNSTYTPTVVPPPTASGDGSQGVKGQPQTIALITNDVPGDGIAPLDPTTIRLCGSSETAPNCTRQSLTISGEGTYTINPSGTVTFTPDPDFVGSSTPQRYVVADVLGQVTDATIQPNVVPPPAPITADDSETGPADTPMTIDPLVNDSAGTLPAGLSGDVNLVRSSLRLCDRNELAPNCTATQLTTADGTYTVDTATGFVTFTPRQGFNGVVTQPVTYQIANDWTGPTGIGIATAVITPIIDPAAPPVVPPTLPGDSSVPSTDGSTSAVRLPNTGAETCALVVWGLLLVCSGGALVVLKRRAISTR